MATLSPKVWEFLKVVGINHLSLDLKRYTYFNDIITAQRGKNIEIRKFVTLNPDILTMKIKDYFIFDYFFEKVVQFRDGVDAYNFWLETIEDVLILLNEQDNADDIKFDNRYINKLQSSMKSHTFLFDLMINRHGFSIGDTEFLTYSLIVRGEVDKLKILASICEIKNFKGIYAAALRYGRIEVLKYLDHGLKLKMDDYGKIMNFDNFQDNPRYMYYTITIGFLSLSYDNPKVFKSRQNYEESIMYLIQNDYTRSINKNTIFQWVDKMETLKYKWDIINFKEIMELLRPYITEKIPLTQDYGKYNEFVHGKMWSERESIIEYCRHLETELEDIKEKYDDLACKYYTSFTK